MVGVAVERPQIQRLGGSRIFGGKALGNHQRTFHVLQLIEQQAGPLHAQPARQLRVALALRTHFEQIAQQRPLLGLAIELLQLGQRLSVGRIASGQRLQHLDQRLPLLGTAIDLFQLAKDGRVGWVARQCLAQQIGQRLPLLGLAIELFQLGKGGWISRIARQLLFQQGGQRRPLFGLAQQRLEVGKGCVVVWIARQHLFVERTQRLPAFGLAEKVLQLGQGFRVLRIAVEYLLESRDGLVDPGGIAGADSRHAQCDLGRIRGVSPLVFELGDLPGEVIPLARLLGQAFGVGEQIGIAWLQAQRRHHHGIGSISGAKLLVE